MTIFKLNSKYKLLVKPDEQVLAYNAVIKKEDEIFVTFVDKFGKEYTYNKNCIISVEEVSNGN